MTTSEISSPPSARLRGRTTLVTGSTSGIGAAIALRLAADGAHVLVSGRDAQRADAVIGEILAGGGHADFVAADLSATYAAIRAFVAEATKRARRSDRHPDQ